MNDTILGVAVGTTLALTILECGFWVAVVWIIIKNKKRNKYEKV